ncbi:xanthine dehydrogenase family protein molybdopterin-binding subunit [Sulfitobacter sp. JB4-11]|uniref:xanthine dehydrogenase family protein molybdopterin-binding subunit n=1 Tax=Sulfitobacter rhodophyticola TaxID=3238304 RepID=UPI003D81B7CD
MSIPPSPQTARLTGRGCYAADAPLEKPLYLAFLRSPVAAGRISTLAVAEGLATRGVHAVHTGTDVDHLGDLSVNPVIPISTPLAYPLLAKDQVEAVGQPVAAVLADTPHAALDGAEAILLDVPDDALPPPRTVAAQRWQAGDCEAAFDQATWVVDVTIRHPRLAPCPMEPRGISVDYDPATGCVTIWHATQTPHRTRSELARMLSLDPSRLRVIAQDVGGAFGMKASLYPEEAIAVWAAFRHRRSIRWIATRSDDFLSATQGRGLHSHGTLALDAAGSFLALKADITAPLGHWMPHSALIPAWNGARTLPSGYQVGAVDIATRAQSGPLGPTGIYRGAGRPEANALMERLVDKAARACAVDPLELRRRNLLSADALPFKTATGNTLDSGDYTAALDRLYLNSDYANLRQQQTARRKEGELVGIGTAFYLEPSGSGWESARVTLHPDGRAEIASGSSSQGQARRETYTRIASDALGITPDQITVDLADTATCPEGIGALASRSTAIGGSAVHVACQAARARRNGGETGVITVEERYENAGQAWGYGACLVMVSIDADTGVTTIEKACCVDDAGVVVNASASLGQIRGGFAQGLGEALMEAVHYDADGQLLTGSLMDYAVPRAGDIPPLEIASLCTPSPMNALGAKGVGEAGTISAPIAILNGVLDALAPLGITDLDMPLTPCKLWHAMDAAKTRTSLR